jgi:pilus assembly protein CpaE
MGIMTKHPSGLYVLPSPTGLDGINLASPEIMEKILELMRDVFDFIVIDSGQTLDDISLKILEMADTVFIAAILSLPCLSNVRKLLWIFKRIGYPSTDKTKIIVNRFHKKSLISLKEAEKVLNQEISHLIANDYQTTSAINQVNPSAVAQRKMSREFSGISQFGDGDGKKGGKEGIDYQHGGHRERRDYPYGRRVQTKRIFHEKRKLSHKHSNGKIDQECFYLCFMS